MAPKRSRAGASSSGTNNNTARKLSSCNQGSTGISRGGEVGSTIATTSLSASLPDDTTNNDNIAIMDTITTTNTATISSTSNSTTTATTKITPSFPKVPLFSPEPHNATKEGSRTAFGSGCSCPDTSRRSSSSTTAATNVNSDTYVSPLMRNSVFRGHSKLTDFLQAQPPAKDVAAMEGITAAGHDQGNNNRALIEDEGCLHCHQKVKGMPKIKVLQEDEDGGWVDAEIDDDDDDDSEVNIQVRCDECQAYICNGCHWCHEFQANHEIRVCDRCDAFYCKACDEMDQCDDCGEVVCGSCSTLLSCKFCGGGLCEGCATACGR
jgi:hypothetical protein